jgi:hypothetical protein
MKHGIMTCVRSVTIAVALAGATLANASDLALLRGSFQPLWYSDVKLGKDVDKIVEKTAGLFNSTVQFNDDSLDDFERWTKNNLNDGELDIIWLNGSMPRFLWPGGVGKPLARQWLDTGNMFINVGQTFADQSWECEGGCEVNGLGAAQDILDGVGGEIFVRINAVRGEGGANVVIKKTPAGEKYLPSMCDRPPTSFTMKISEVKGDWEVADSFATLSGEEPGDFADPVVIHNKKTNGYLLILSQSGGNLWCSRGGPSADFMNNWVPANAIGFGVAPAGKLVTRWADIKRATE